MVLLLRSSDFVCSLKWRRCEQRICIKFCFKLEKSCAETIKTIQNAFGVECIGKTQIKECYKRFKNVGTSVDSVPRPGRPSSTITPENIERVRLAIEDCRLTVRELESDLGIPKTCVSSIVTDNLGMTRVCAKFIPKLLKVEQKRLRFKVAQDNLEMVADDENVFKKIITGDE